MITLKLTVWKHHGSVWKNPAEMYVSIYFPCKGSKWNPQVDNILVWKPVETSCKVSLKSTMQRNEVELPGWLGEETRENHLWGVPKFPMQGI